MKVHQSSYLIQMLKLLYDLRVISHLSIDVSYAPLNIDPLGYYDALDHTDPLLDVTIARYE